MSKWIIISNEPPHLYPSSFSHRKLLVANGLISIAGIMMTNIPDVINPDGCDIGRLGKLLTHLGGIKIRVRDDVTLNDFKWIKK